MEGELIRTNEWLLPLSWIYGLGVRLRNFLFDAGLLKSRAFDIPVIAVGNITVGGTGKTPHVEYLIGLLHKKFKVAVLSRGYKRKTSGFVLAEKDSTATDIGDEPYQMKRKFSNVTIAVDAKRVRGIERLARGDRKIETILLDDAFQHRYVKPGINILLVDYNRLVVYDKLLPVGRLREPFSGKNRADIVIVTKCPDDLRPMDFRVITKAMDLYPYQQLFFTTLVYDPLRPLYPAGAVKAPKLSELDASTHVLLLAGIALPEKMQADIRKMTDCQLTALTFADHHHFSPKDVERINSTFRQLPSPRLIITTEKDAARLTLTEGLSNEVKRSLFLLPVRVTFMLDQEQTFNEIILDYVRKNSRNGILAKSKDDNKPEDRHRPGNRSRTISFRNN